MERGEAALRTLGSEQWATAGDQEAPRLISTMMMSYGITAVPPWRHGHCEGSGLEPRDAGKARWIGTRYARPQTDQPDGIYKPRLPTFTEARKPRSDPRLDRWRANPPARTNMAKRLERETSKIVDAAYAAAAGGATFAAATTPSPEQNEVKELRAMGIGTPRSGDSFNARAPAKVERAASATSSLRSSDQDFSWVSGAFAQRPVRHWLRVQSNVSPPKGRPDGVSALALELLNPNSKSSCQARFKAPIVASG